MRFIDKTIIAIMIIFKITGLLQAQNNFNTDTLKINLPEAEKKFLENNLQLLAAKYYIDASKASTLQAQLWSNPNLSYEQNIYNWNTKKWFDITSSGNSEFQIQQLILLAGKRTKQVNLTEINTKSSELQFYELIRNLKYTLRKNFYDLQLLQKSLKFYDESIITVQQTVSATQAIFEKKSILMSELLRLKALLFTLQNEREGIYGQILDLQSTLHILFADSSKQYVYYMPEKDLSPLENISFDNIRIEDLIERGLTSRPDFQISNNAVVYEEKDLDLQKALATPDLTVGGRWSRAGSYIPDYYAISLSLDLPVFNRNQGNIQVSEATIQVNKALRDQLKKSIQNDITDAYKKALSFEKLYKSLDKSFANQYTQYVQSMLENYEKRNITIIELTDFYESYRNARIQINQLQNNLIDALELLNFSVGQDIIKF